MTSSVIATINYLFKFVIIYTVKSWGIGSFTEETKVTKQVISYLTLFNKCFLIIALTANFEVGEFLFNGPYSDFNARWFRTNG